MGTMRAVSPMPANSMSIGSSASLGVEFKAETIGSSDRRIGPTAPMSQAARQTETTPMALPTSIRANVAPTVPAEFARFEHPASPWRQSTEGAGKKRGFKRRRETSTCQVATRMVTGSQIDSAIPRSRQSAGSAHAISLALPTAMPSSDAIRRLRDRNSSVIVTAAARGRGSRIAELGYDPARLAAEHQDPVAEQQSFLHVVRHEDHGLVVLLPKAEQPLLKFEAPLAVQSRERLVHEHDRRIAQETPRHCHALLHAKRQLTRVGPLPAGKTEPVEQFPCPLLAFAPWHTLHFTAKRRVLQNRHPGKQAVLLGDEQHGLIPVGRGSDPLHLALYWRNDAGENSQESGLAAATRPHKGEEFPFAGLETQVLKRADRALSRFEPHSEMRATQTHL